MKHLTPLSSSTYQETYPQNTLRSSKLSKRRIPTCYCFPINIERQNMQFSTFTNVVLALSAGAQGLPSSQNIPIDHISTSIYERGKVANLDGSSIASFMNEVCPGDPAYGPLLDNGKTGPDGCIPFSTQLVSIGINWGRPPTSVSKVLVYSHDKCQKTSTDINAPNQPNHDGTIGMDACVSQGAYGGPWASIAFVPAPPAPLPPLHCIITPSGCF